jgi:hypothetical protein
MSEGLTTVNVEIIFFWGVNSLVDISDVSEKLAAFILNLLP